MAIKLYLKKGNKNYKERRLLDALESTIAEKIKTNPELEREIIPATNFSELETMYSKYVVEDASEIEEIEPKNTETMKDAEDVDFEETELKNDDDFMDDDTSFVDPLNRENTIVREYVLGDDSLSKTPTMDVDPFKKFDEPQNFSEAFDIPDANVIEEESAEQSKSESQSSQSKQESKSNQQRSEPLNPNFDDMSNGKKKRSTKKFAKYIVETICMLSEKGFVWFANKDINDAKLTEYELNGEMDLSVLVSLEDGQQITVKQFFQSQCLQAEKLATIPDEQKTDLADALAEVLMEKGVGPTPTQELMLVAFSVFGGQFLSLMTLKAQTGSLLTQLRAMNDGNSASQEREQNYEQQPSYAAPQQEEFIPEKEPELTQIDLMADANEIESVIETKE